MPDFPSQNALSRRDALRTLVGGALAVGALVAGIAGTARPAAARVARAAETALRKVGLPFLWPSKSVYGLAAAAPDSVWFVGVQGELTVPGPIPGTGKTVGGSPVIRRWDGRGWKEHPIRNWSGNGGLHSVAAPSPADVWVAGLVRGDQDTVRPYLARFTGSAFEPVAPPPGLTLWIARYPQLKATPAGLFLNGGTDRAHHLYRWAGTGWTAYPDSGLHQVRVFDARTPGDVWMIGELEGGYGRPAARHWDGTAWGEVPLPPLTYEVGLPGDVLAIAADDVWVTGSDEEFGSGNARTALLWHWDGRAWSKASVPSGAEVPDGFHRDPDGSFWGHRIDPAAPGRLVVLRYDGSAWRPTGTTLVAPDNLRLSGPVRVPGTGRFWTQAGDGTTILTDQP
ncbi:hypothetical protein [Actinomadura hibisca]|uniref:hypothetical protein n=1 Tax=Actinomadura hibisca TaxID=68565 RepID=UPI00082D6EA1|nr:hypothetical protein [Actinomadura hibisca]